MTYTNKELEEAIFFYGGKLSQWYNCRFIINNIEYNCAEQYMMAEKARVFNDQNTLRDIMSTDDPRMQKSLGRKVKNFDKRIWDHFCYPIVLAGNFAKFKQNQDLKEYLLSTGNKVLVEASPYDTIWGIGLGIQDPLRLDQKNWRGQNLLGSAIMEARYWIRTQND